jgi:glycosyltransferase involved in cell wall biosynthesis
MCGRCDRPEEGSDVRILMTVHHELDGGAGAPGATLRLAEEFVRAGHRVDLYSFEDLPRRLGGRGRTVLFPWFVRRHMRAAAAREPYDVVDASSGDSAWLDATAPRMRRTLLVVRSHGLEHVHDARVHEGGPPTSWRDRLYHGRYRLAEVARAMRRADLNLMLNRGDARYATTRLGVAPDRVRVVANGVPAAFLLRGSARPVAQPRVVVVGGYLDRKGVAYGAAALNTLLARHTDLTAVFLGTNCPAQRVLADFADAVRPRVRVVPRYPNGALPELLRTGDIHLFPTLAEGFPLALLETMARGLVPVVTAVDGPTEVASHGLNAFVVPPRDPDALVRAVESLLCDPDLRAELSARAAVTARAYTWPRVAAENLRLMTEALARKHPLAAAPVPIAQGGSCG